MKQNSPPLLGYESIHLLLTLLCTGLAISAARAQSFSDSFESGYTQNWVPSIGGCGTQTAQYTLIDVEANAHSGTKAIYMAQTPSVGGSVTLVHSFPNGFQGRLTVWQYFPARATVQNYTQWAATCLQVNDASGRNFDVEGIEADSTSVGVSGQAHGGGTEIDYNVLWRVGSGWHKITIEVGPSGTTGSYDDRPLPHRHPTLTTCSSVGFALGWCHRGPVIWDDFEAAPAGPTGALQLTLAPQAAMDAGAQWRRVGTGTWRNSGDIETNLPVGTYTVGFKPLTGWDTPANQPVTVTSNATATASATYVLQTGSLRVTITPLKAVIAGAQWHRLGSSSPHKSGDTETNVPTGPCTVELSEVSGFLKPTNAICFISSGATTTLVVYYLPSPVAGFLPYRGVNLAGADFPDMGLGFTDDDLLNESSLIQKLKTQSDSVSQFVWNQFSNETRLVLSDTNSSTDPTPALLAELNKLISGLSIFDVWLFLGVTLSQDTQHRLAEILAQNPSPPDESLNRLNRELLQDNYPSELRRYPFGDHLPGILGTHYTFPTDCEVPYFVNKGMNIIRLPFRWERLQRTLKGDLDANELAHIQDFVNSATSQGAYVLLDPHNYARWHGYVIGGSDVSTSDFANFWSQLAANFSPNDYVIFGLMNEPHNMPTETWRDSAQAAINAIRKTGAKNLILVPGNEWSSAENWTKDYYDPGNPNATVMTNITDPLSNYAFEVHQYLDGHGGTTDTCINTSIGVDLISDFTAWCRDNHKRGFLGEFAGGRNDRCYLALDNMLAYMQTNSDVWLGWTYWAAGPWWFEYRFTIEPSNFTVGICQTPAIDRPPMKQVLENYLPIPTHYCKMSNRDQFQLTTVDGYSYQVEASSNLLAGSWRSYGPAFPGNGLITSIPMTAQTNAHEFYRVRVTRVP